MVRTFARDPRKLLVHMRHVGWGVMGFECEVGYDVGVMNSSASGESTAAQPCEMSIPRKDPDQLLYNVCSVQGSKLPVRDLKQLCNRSGVVFPGWKSSAHPQM
jgi:hypothetical protein